MASPVVGCFHDLLASSWMRPASWPASGGEASSGPMIAKRRRAHRRRAGASSSGLIGWLIGASSADATRVAPPSGRPDGAGSTGADGPVVGALAPAGHGSWGPPTGDAHVVARGTDPTSPRIPRRSAILCGAPRSGETPREIARCPAPSPWSAARATRASPVPAPSACPRGT